MFPTFLITFREVIEAAVIVSLVISILKKNGSTDSIRIVWYAVVSAIVVCFTLVLGGSLVGFQLGEVFQKYEEQIEGTLMFITVFFITWTVFYLHDRFSKSQRKLTGQIVDSLKSNASRGVFALIFTSVFREGLEIILFLSTFFITSTPKEVISGFVYGIVGGIATAAIFYGYTQKIELRRVTRIINAFLILFAAGLLIRGIHEFTEIGLIPNIGEITLGFIPASTTLVGGMLKSLLGITKSLNMVQLLAYLVFVILLSHKIHIFPKPHKITGIRSEIES